MHRTTTCYLVAPFSVLFFLLFAFNLLSNDRLLFFFYFFISLSMNVSSSNDSGIGFHLFLFCFCRLLPPYRLLARLSAVAPTFFFFQNKKKQKTKIFIDRPLRRDREKRNTTKKKRKGRRISQQKVNLSKTEYLNSKSAIEGRRPKSLSNEKCLGPFFVLKSKKRHSITKSKGKRSKIFATGTGVGQNEWTKKNVPKDQKRKRNFVCGPPFKSKNKKKKMKKRKEKVSEHFVDDRRNNTKRRNSPQKISRKKNEKNKIRTSRPSSSNPPYQ